MSRTGGKSSRQSYNEIRYHCS